jgi:ATP-dependent DNA helicase RecG
MQEDSHTEFKSSFSDAVIESLVAFTNTKGGKVLVGVDNEGNPIKSFTIGGETLQNWVNEVKNKTQPSIIPDAEIITIQGKDVASLYVQEFPIKPVSFKGRYFKRVRNSNHQLSLTEISDLHLKSFNSSWDSYINPEYTVDTLSLDKVRDFVAMCNKDREVRIEDDPLTVLTKFELIKASWVTNACYLLFADHDVFSASMELGRFDTATSIKDSLSIRSNLFTEVEDVINFVRKHINKSYIISGDPQREERWQYPIPAIREIVINMIVHRDYTHYGDSSVKIFNDHIEFFNPGRLPGDISIANLLSGQYISQARKK